MATRFVLILASVVLWTQNCNAQPCKTNLSVINTPSALAESTKANPDSAFVSLLHHIPGLVTDLRYATTHNFTHKVLYRHPAALLRKPPADALRKVQEELNKKGLGLKIFDAYRPFSVSCILWQQASDKRYVANPKRGSHHNRGTALDLTIIHLRTGKELNMGTDFDNFTDTAHHSFLQLPPEVLANRRLLKNIMWKHGFNFVPTEWWHYHWRNKNFDLVDLDFDSIK
jgi:D-alanyl-D-alanine dipeptidase